MMPLTKDKRKLNKLIQQSDSDDSEHELSYYANDRIKLMKEVLKIVKPKKIKLMAPSCLKSLDTEEINSMLLEELLGISNKRLKYIFNGQSLEEDSSSSTSEDEPIDIISLDDISDDELVINVDDNEEASQQKKKRKETKHHKCKKERVKCSMKKENLNNEKNPSEKDGEIDSNKNLMSVLELLELQARARAIKSQLLLENAKTQESLSLSKIPTVEQNVGSDDEVIIKTAKTEEIIITSSDDEENGGTVNTKNSLGNEVNKEDCNILEKDKVNDVAASTGTSLKSNDTITETQKIKILENKELSSEKLIVEADIHRNDSNSEKVDHEAIAENSNLSLEIIAENSNVSQDTIVENPNLNEEAIAENSNLSQEIKEIDKVKTSDNDGIIQINLSDDEMEEMK